MYLYKISWQNLKLFYRADILYEINMFHEAILNNFKVIEWTLGHNLIIWNKERGIITSELKAGLLFFISVRRLIMLYICIKFHEDILNGFNVTEQTEPHYMK